MKWLPNTGGVFASFFFHTGNYQLSSSQCNPPLIKIYMIVKERVSLTDFGADLQTSAGMCNVIGLPILPADKGMEIRYQKISTAGGNDKKKNRT